MDEKNVVIITGSTGLIGNPTVKKLASRYSAVGFDRRGSPHPRPEAECVCVDVTDDESVRAGLARVRYAYGKRIAAVIHLAAYDFSGEPSTQYEEVTVRGTERLLRALQAFEVELVVLSSTMLVHAPSLPDQKINEVDKTGTLTMGKPRLMSVVPMNGSLESDVLQAAASLEKLSEHRLATAILAGAEDRKIQLMAVEDFQSVTGKDVIGTLQGKRAAIGNAALMSDLGASLDVLRSQVETLQEEGNLIVEACCGIAQRLRLLTLCSLLSLGAMAQGPAAAAPKPANPPPQRSIEDLNLKGAAAYDPPFTDSILGRDTPIRTNLFRHGLLFRMGANAAYIQNTLAAPVAANAQTYTGQRQFGAYSLSPVLTADLRQFGLRKTQLNITGHLQQGSWDQAQPDAWTFCNLYLYKEFDEDRIELQLGYLATDEQFIGLQVGGQVASGAQGVYAVLPYEVGISYAPLPAPAITLKYRWHSGPYLKAAAQRAAQPGSEQDALKRDAIGLRFLPHGDKLVLIGEAGINRPAVAGKLQEWYRAGYIANNTPYTSLRTGLKKSGNYSGYLLADHQVWQPEQTNPGRGVYVGGSAMVVPADLNVYHLYYEARIYDEAPFHGRLRDFASIVASHTAFSQDDLRNLAAARKSYWRASDSVTGSYTVHLAPGTYLGLGLSYVNGPAVTPKVPSALTFTVQTSLFF